MADSDRAQRESRLAAEFGEDRQAGIAARMAALGDAKRPETTESPEEAVGAMPGPWSSSTWQPPPQISTKSSAEAEESEDEEEEEDPSLREQAQMAALSAAQQDEAAGGLEEAQAKGRIRARAAADSKQAAKKKADLRLMFGSGLIRLLWLCTALSLYQTVWLLDLLFLLQFLFPFFRKFIPEVGAEWGATRKLGKAGLLGIKIGEILALIFLSFYAFFYDVYGGVILFFLVAAYAFLKETGVIDLITVVAEKLTDFFNWL